MDFGSNFDRKGCKIYENLGGRRQGRRLLELLLAASEMGFNTPSTLPEAGAADIGLRPLPPAPLFEIWGQGASNSLNSQMRSEHHGSCQCEAKLRSKFNDFGLAGSSSGEFLCVSRLLGLPRWYHERPGR